MPASTGKSPSLELIRQNTRTHKSNEYLRYNLTETVNSVKQYGPVYRAYYQKKFNEVPKFSHKRSLVLTVRKLVRLMDVLFCDHLTYTPMGGESSIITCIPTSPHYDFVRSGWKNSL
jgi:hypothetical protein